MVVRVFIVAGVTALGFAAPDMGAVPSADACGVKLTVKAPKPKKTVGRSDHPSQVLLLGETSRQTANLLAELGHKVEVASDPDRARRKKYQVIVAEASLRSVAQAEWDGVILIDGDGSPRSVAKRVEEALERAPRARLVTRDPKSVKATKEPFRSGGGDGATSAGKKLLNQGGGDGSAVDQAVKRPAVAPTADTAQPARQVQFHNGSTELTDSYRARLDLLVTHLAAHPGARVTVEGHASSTGSATANMAISGARAQAVKDYLMSQGVDASRIDTQALGDEQPRYQPSSSGKNRRVEIRVK